MPKIVGLDFGQKRIGVAISDEDQRNAFGRATIQNLNLDDVIKQIKELCDEEDVKKIVLGWPKSLKNENNNLTDQIKRFGSMLEKKCSVTVEYEDERLTTQLAIKQLRDVPGRSAKADCDRLAATAILQGYLERQA